MLHCPNSFTQLNPVFLQLIFHAKNFKHFFFIPAADENKRQRGSKIVRDYFTDAPMSYCVWYGDMLAKWGHMEGLFLAKDGLHLISFQIIVGLVLKHVVPCWWSVTNGNWLPLRLNYFITSTLQTSHVRASCRYRSYDWKLQIVKKSWIN